MEFSQLFTPISQKKPQRGFKALGGEEGGMDTLEIVNEIGLICLDRGFIRSSLSDLI
ncbi:unnamed protein product [Rodentolepis nana]|uniref:Uncharacterized protein n=1 Tax=Rodentolepis nana TaxID=102285 RepID=A0A0R3TB30_RODNA|nr:unnamed protein product [Rodentolepis nana]